MRINSIVPKSYVDGPGQRTVVFFQGCTLACPGCQNRALWPSDGGQEKSVSEVFELIVEACTTHGHWAVTFSGGEPFQQALALSALVRKCKEARMNVVIYSGYTLEEITHGVPSTAADAWTASIAALANADILVDGPYMREQDDQFTTWRGSRNQRAIDLKTRQELDWNGMITITADGQLVMPEGLANLCTDIGTLDTSPMCGQVNRGREN